MKRYVACALLIAGVMAMMPVGLSASVLRESSGDHNQVGFGETLTIDEGQATRDVVCFFCTVHVHGDLSGDLVSFFGTVDVSDGHAISGDSVLFGGRLRLGNEARVGGDLVVFGTELEQAVSASVRGDHVIFAGTGWLLAPLLVLLIPIGLIWLVLRLIFRRRYTFPAYPMGRRF